MSSNQNESDSSPGTPVQANQPLFGSVVYPLRFLETAEIFITNRGMIKRAAVGKSALFLTSGPQDSGRP